MFQFIFSTIQINTNGFISFQNDYPFMRPAGFPHSNMLNADLLGIYWSDADSSGVYQGCCGVDMIYYHIYSDKQNQSLRIYSRATADGRKYVSPKFTANWVMVITWSQMIPYPFETNQFSNEVSRC